LKWFLSFKLNLSHELKLKLPGFIKRVVINKTNLVFESYDSILLGNFVESIYNLKPKNPYGGKGFSLKSKVVPLKEVKKKSSFIMKKKILIQSDEKKT